jgi:hypothetical protein
MMAQQEREHQQLPVAKQLLRRVLHQEAAVAP